MARTDNDSWDLASSVGATATAVAASRAVASQGPDALLDDPFAEPLVRAVGLDAFVKIVDGEVVQRRRPVDEPQDDERADRGQDKVFRRLLHAASEAGIRQAVILAAGLDTRGYRLAWPQGTVVFEVDQPEVIAFKTATLDEARRRADGGRARPSPSTCATTGRRHCATAGFDPAQPTAWIAEGLLPYLPPDAQDRLFDHITALSPRQPAGHRAHGHERLPDDWAEKLDERSRRAGSDINLSRAVLPGRPQYRP